MILTKHQTHIYIYIYITTLDFTIKAFSVRINPLLGIYTWTSMSDLTIWDFLSFHSRTCNVILCRVLHRFRRIRVISNNNNNKTISPLSQLIFLYGSVAGNEIDIRVTWNNSNMWTLEHIIKFPFYLNGSTFWKQPSLLCYFSFDIIQ